MQRVTITIEPDLLEKLDAFMQKTGATNRSEALRDLARRALRETAIKEEAQGQCVGVLSYVYDQSLRDLGKRLTARRHERHDETVATTTVPLDHSVAIEVAIMQGEAAHLHAFAEGVFLERGVKHGTLSLVPVDLEHDTHAHGPHSPREHVHMKVRDSF